MKNSILIITFCIVGLTACKTKQPTLKTGAFENEIFTIAGVTGCKESHSGDAVDSQIGQINCDNISFSYDYGLYGARGPQTLKEQFRSSFDSYHYSKFFEVIHIDSKVQEIFKDSINIEKIELAEKNTEKLLFECEPCNVVAHINFKGKTYYYPTTMNKSSLEKDYSDIQFLTTDNQSIKTYSSENNELAVKITNLPDRRNRPYLALAVKSSNMSIKSQRDILQSIRLQYLK